MEKKTILVTGSTDGIGRATARALLRQGQRVIIHGRNAEKGHQVVKDLGRETGTEAVDLLIADLSSQEAIRRLSDEILSHHPLLDVLINNAGTYQMSRQLTEDRMEMTFAVNYLSPFLLTARLMDAIKLAAPSRIVNVASSAHRDVSAIDWNNLQGEKKYEPWEAYSLSKFAMVTFTYRLSEILEGTGITVNCLHPGVINTKLLRSAFPEIPGASPEEGAKTSVCLATSPKVNGVSGKYYEEMRLVRSEPLTYEKDIQERLWRLAEGLTGITYT